MDLVHTIIYAALAEDKAQDLLSLILRLLPLAWFVLEVVVLIEVGQAIGGLAVAGLLLCGMVAGVLLLRHAGTSVVGSMMAPSQSQRPALERLRSAGWQVAAGLLLIVPGFLSDIMALLLFLPPVRQLISSRMPHPRRRGMPTVVIEGEVLDVTSEPRDQERDHGTGGNTMAEDASKAIESDNPSRPNSPWSRPGPS